MKNFWKLLISLVNKRNDDLREYRDKEENLDKTGRKVLEEFNEANLEILKELAELWNKILAKAGLEFDYESAKKPVQLNDNLMAYIKLKSTGKLIRYSQLSSGIRNFIFKVGHIFALYFNRQVRNGFLLIDEPENSLFPDFLYDLVETYQQITHNTQMIMATHNPIIAAQFEPYERFILEFDDDGNVTSRRGQAPAGDDPGDVLVKDFGIRSLLGKKGVENWERFIELRTLMSFEEDQDKKEILVQEYLRIGGAYNFPTRMKES